MNMKSVATIPTRLRGQALAVAVKSTFNELASMTPALDFNDKASILDVDLEEAIDGIISKAKEEITAEVPAPAPVEPVDIDPATIFEFGPVKNKQGRYRLVNNELRHFIFDSMETRIIDRNMLEIPGDTEQVKATRLRISVQPLELYYQYFKDFSEITEEDVKTSDSNLTWAEYQVFFTDLATRHNGYVAKREAEEAAQKAIHLAAFDRGVVTFTDLEIGLREESKTRQTYVFRNGDQNIAGKILMVRRQTSMMGPYLEIYVAVHSRNEEGLNCYTHSHIIYGFNETETLENLHVARLVEDSDIAKALIERGAKYLEITKKPSYVNSTGNMTRKTGRNIEVLNAQGRVMIDLQGMTDMDTNYYHYFCKADEGSSLIPYENVAEVSDEIKLSCVPYVYGFSFKAKRWGQLNIASMEPIEFRTDAYEMLVLDQETKDLIFASVTDNSSDNDIIAGKGGGSVNLLEGPPGVGKTLTAEAVAEKLQKPLYMVSVGELGTTVDDLESNLKDILEIAATWKAVLLIDEADIFLETRDKHDVIRNAMVAVFLRLLEYYQGVMFLTTNRADNLDPAFESRITLCIHFSDLEVKARKQVWTNLLKAAKINTWFDLDQLSAHALNGRQIKGIIKSARSLARFRGVDLDIDHFEAVIKQKADFKKATVYKLGHGLDDHKEEVEKPGLWKRLVDAVTGK